MLGLQKIIQELQEKLAIATGKGRTLIDGQKSVRIQVKADEQQDWREKRGKTVNLFLSKKAAQLEMLETSSDTSMLWTGPLGLKL